MKSELQLWKRLTAEFMLILFGVSAAFIVDDY